MTPHKAAASFGCALVVELEGGLRVFVRLNADYITRGDIDAAFRSETSSEVSKTTQIRFVLRRITLEM